jgi:hypothetical protein
MHSHIGAPETQQCQTSFLLQYNARPGFVLVSRRLSSGKVEFVGHTDKSTTEVIVYLLLSFIYLPLDDSLLPVQRVLSWVCM